MVFAQVFPEYFLHRVLDIWIPHCNMKYQEKYSTFHVSMLLQNVHIHVYMLYKEILYKFDTSKKYIATYICAVETAKM